MTKTSEAPLAKPQIIPYQEADCEVHWTRLILGLPCQYKSRCWLLFLKATVAAVAWVPCSPRLLAAGTTLKNTGFIQVSLFILFLSGHCFGVSKRAFVDRSKKSIKRNEIFHWTKYKTLKEPVKYYFAGKGGVWGRHPANPQLLLCWKFCRQDTLHFISLLMKIFWGHLYGRFAKGGEVPSFPQLFGKNPILKEVGGGVPLVDQLCKEIMTFTTRILTLVYRCSPWVGS